MKKQPSTSLFIQEWTQIQREAMERRIAAFFEGCTINTKRDYKTLYTFEDVNRYFGFAYTSSSDYAALWVCNIDPICKHDRAYTYNAFAITPGNNFIAVCHNAEEKEQYVPLGYGDYVITPNGNFFQFIHNEYDPTPLHAEDPPADNRCGDAKTIDECVDQIADLEEFAERDNRVKGFNVTGDVGEGVCSLIKQSEANLKAIKHFPLAIELLQEYMNVPKGAGASKIAARHALENRIEKFLDEVIPVK